MEPTIHQLCVIHEAGRLTDEEFANKIAVRLMLTEDWAILAEAAFTGMIPVALFCKAQDAHESNQGVL